MVQKSQKSLYKRHNCKKHTEIFFTPLIFLHKTHYFRDNLNTHINCNNLEINFVFTLEVVRFVDFYHKKKRKVVEIPIERIVPNPSQPRRIFVQTELDNLSNSIKESGLLQPLTVRRLGANQYELIAGERRLRACRIAGFKNSFMHCE